jgi:hypothetical protein
MYHICLVVRFVLPDMRHTAFLYLLGICCERTDTLKAKTNYLSIIAHCFMCCFSSSLTPHMRLSFSISVSFRNYFCIFHYFDSFHFITNTPLQWFVVVSRLAEGLRLHRTVHRVGRRPVMRRPVMRRIQFMLPTNSLQVSLLPSSFYILTV